MQRVGPTHEKHMGPMVRMEKTDYRGKMERWSFLGPLSFIPCKLEDSHGPYIRGCCEDKILNTRKDLSGAWDEWPCVHALRSSTHAKVGQQASNLLDCLKQLSI